ncbi:polyprenyl synthetase family protein [Gaetbulibacter aestuarii]|uniref:Polyprenyl synthetase family protein n=1 Tax=Gaetbulibacter aestuarii TaxID=1502358 RepID=A0ABW7MX79_9FLAO
MLSIQEYQDYFLSHLKTYAVAQEPKHLYEPAEYILNLGGKRLRPVLTLMTTDIFNGHYKEALQAAMCVEVFHNFTLVHDDIMDAAPLRRGQETVHEKWDVNTGILSGDAMLIIAYRFLENYSAETFKSLFSIFNKTALEVCEGQQYDVDFETRNDVTIPEYLKMIEYKTAVLVGCAMKMGAIIAGASVNDQVRIYEFGKNLGIAFQLQDDYLDAFGDPETFGKQVGGDIIENKKTFLYLKALEYSKGSDRENLKTLFSSNPEDPSEKIKTVKQLFKTSGAAEETKKAIEDYSKKAYAVLNDLDISDAHKSVLKDFGDKLMNRTV